MNQNKVSIALAVLLTASMVLTVAPSVVVANTVPASKIFFEEGAEEPTFDEWNVRWAKYDANPLDSLDYWCRSGHNVHSGGYAAYCAKSGYNSHYTNATNNQTLDANILASNSTVPQTEYVLRYDTNQDSIMRKELVGARYYDTITFTFWFYSDTGASDAKQPLNGVSVGYDFLNVIYYTGNNGSLVKHVLWTDTEAQAYAKTWTQVSVNVPNNATWVGYEFVSGTVPPAGGDAPDAFSAYGITTEPAGSSGMKEGVFVDDISCIGTDPATIVDTVAPVTELDIWGHAQGGTYTGAVAITLTSSDATSGLDRILYRLDGGEWKVYTSNIGLTTSGVHSIAYYAIDKAGNSEAVRNEVITIVNGTSGIVFQGDARNYPSGNVTIGFTVASSLAINKLEYSLDGGAFVEIDPTSTSVSLSGLADGNHNLTVRAVDASNHTIEDMTNFTVGRISGGILGDPLVLVGLAAAATVVIGGMVWVVKRKKT